MRAHLIRHLPAADRSGAPALLGPLRIEPTGREVAQDLPVIEASATAEIEYKTPIGERPLLDTHSEMIYDR